MVPLENKLNYLSTISENSKLFAFHCFINGKSVIVPQNDLKEIDQIYFGLMKSLADNDKESFGKYYSQISRRQIDSQSTSPFIHDDALIFILLVGIIKYQYSNDWIKKVLEVRATSEVTGTFKAIIENNYFSKSNLPYLVLPFLDLIGLTSALDQLLDDTYSSISNSSELFNNRNDFLILLSLRAYDIVILSKVAEAGVLSNLKSFEARFKNRTNILARIVYNIILFLFIYGLWRLLSMNPTIKESVNDVGTIVGIFGVQILGNLFPSLFQLVLRLIQRILGYK